MEREDMDKIVAASEWKGYWESLINENTALRAELAALKTVLHSISLGSQNTMTTKEDLGAEARRALATLAEEG